MPAANSSRGRGHEGAARAPIVHSISSLPVSGAEDRGHRVHIYLLAMGIRTGCFVLGGVFLMLGVHSISWVWFVAAAVLPYPAVVLANNVNRRTSSTQPYVPAPQVLTAEPHVDPHARPPEVIVGEPVGPDGS